MRCEGLRATFDTLQAISGWLRAASKLAKQLKRGTLLGFYTPWTGFLSMRPGPPLVSKETKGRAMKL